MRVKCLVVDDSRVIRTVSRHIVESFGFEVTEAANGQEALELCEAAMPDLILLDWNMPVRFTLIIQKLKRATFRPMKHELFPPDGEWQPVIFERQGERLPFNLLADLKVEHRDWQRARLTDMSVSGFKLAWLPNASPGCSVWIRVPGLAPLHAVVRRVGNAGIGCEFDRQLSEYVLEHLARCGATSRYR